MTSASAQTPSIQALPAGTYHASGPVCGIHTYFGPGGAEVTFTRKYRIGAPCSDAPLPATIDVDSLRQLLHV